LFFLIDQDQGIQGSPTSQRLRSRQGSVAREDQASPAPRRPPRSQTNQNVERDMPVQTDEDSSKSTTEVSDQNLIVSSESPGAVLDGFEAVGGSRKSPQRYKAKTFGVSKKVRETIRTQYSHKIATS
jgi:hypothetical protein